MDAQTKEIYLQFQKHLLEGRRLSFQQFDKAILTLSGGGLGLSISFIHQVIQLENAFYKWLLILSWILFALSVMLTLISFITSQFAFDHQLKLAEKYYVDNDECALKEFNKPARATTIINITSAVSFLIAVISLVLFVSFNIY